MLDVLRLFQDGILSNTDIPVLTCEECGSLEPFGVSAMRTYAISPRIG
jgi:hypothetical protein